MRDKLCTRCPEFPNGHFVAASDFIKHRLQRRAQDISTRSPELQHPIPLNNENVTSLEDLSSKVAAITLTDDGPNIHDQPSKLWTSRADFQDRVSSSLIHSGAGITPADIQQSLRTIGASGALDTSSTGDTPSLDRKVFAKRFREIFRPKHHRSLARVHSIREECRHLHARLFGLPEIDVDDAALVVERHRVLEKASTDARKLGLSLLIIKRIRNEEFDDAMEKARQDLRQIDNVITVLGAQLPQVHLSDPVVFASDYLYDDPLNQKNPIAQLTIFLGLACGLIMGLSRTACDFVIGSVNMIIEIALSTFLPSNNSQPDPRKIILDQIPSSYYAALNVLQLDSKTTVMAVCPACSFVYKPAYSSMATKPSYPSRCNQMVVGENGRFLCNSALLESRSGTERPIKPYAVCSLEEHIARILSDSDLEKICDDVCDAALAKEDPSTEMHSVFDGHFLRTFLGPDGRLFLDRKEKIRLALALQVDFFNPNGLRKRGNSDSIGIISFAILNLPETIRYKPENIFLAAIIPGPREPNSTELPKYMAPIVDMCLLGWRGIRLTRTALQPEGRTAQYAVVLSVNDLPAARSLAGAAGVGSFWCTVCNSGYRVFKSQSEWRYDTSFEKWELRDVNEMRRHAEAWRDAETLSEQKYIVDATGMRWSELWRLPYWDPTRMLVIDSMHCILEGLVHYHCRDVLNIHEDAASKALKLPRAFSHEWKPYVHQEIPVKYQLANNKPIEKQLKEISAIQNLLVQPLNAGEGSIQEQQLRKKLSTNTVPSLRFVAWTLGIHEKQLILKFASKAITAHQKYALKSKLSFINALVEWRLRQPLISDESPLAETKIDLESMRYIQYVIKNTSVPSWVNTVPHLYGKASVGTLKADQWRTLATIFLPIALVTLWDVPSASPRARRVLQHSMFLFQAVNIVCRFTMTRERMTAYRDLLAKWVDELPIVHPETKSHKFRPNLHIAFHIFNFLELFGPVLSWWTFPFERLIGTLQKFNTNDHVGGELEMTILNSFARSANFRRVVGRPGCSPFLLEFQRLFNKAFSSGIHRPETNNESPPPSKKDTHAHYMYHGVNYSRAQTHLGNSLVRYMCAESQTSFVGSIEEIKNVGHEVVFEIRRHQPLPREEDDPFRHYPWFPANSFSASMASHVDTISPREVLCHVARFNYGNNCIVAVDLSRV